MSDKTNYATVKTDDGRTTVFIRNKYILQKHENFRFIPDYNDINDEGQKKPEAVYLSFFYRVAKAGRMIIKFEGLDKSGFENFNEFSYDGELDVTDGYQIFNHSGLWNGTGDFKLSFTGEIYLYMLVLSTDRAEALAYKYKTLFEQSDKLVKIAAANFDKDGNVIESSGIVTTAKYNEMMSQYFDEDGQLKNKAGLVTTAMANTLYAFDADGNIVSMVEQTASDIKISAANISLEGLVTANENFKILEDGSVEANGTFKSEDKEYGNSIVINAKEGYIKMIGPSSVDEYTGKPNGEDRTDLFELHFETDPDTMGRVSTMYLRGVGHEVRIDAIDGVHIKDMLGNLCMISADRIEFQDGKGKIAIYSIDGFNGINA